MNEQAAEAAYARHAFDTAYDEFDEADDVSFHFERHKTMSPSFRSDNCTRDSLFDSTGSPVFGPATQESSASNVAPRAPATSVLRCPRCLSSRIDTRNRARKAGSTIGSVAGATGGMAAALAGAETGAIVGSVAGPIGTVFGGLAGGCPCRTRRQRSRLCGGFRSGRRHRRQRARQPPLPRLPSRLQRHVQLDAAHLRFSPDHHFRPAIAGLYALAYFPSAAQMHLVHTMTYTDQEPWHGLGNRLAPNQPIEV
ncbi:hypothetical protein [Burkholderia sp. 3C]